MLPLLPALLLLILQGPSHVERLAVEASGPKVQGLDSRLPRSHRSESPGFTGQRSDLPRLLLASLMSGANAELSQALFELLQVSAEVSRPDELAPALAREEQPPRCPRYLGDPKSGFLLSHRTRDGPSVR